MMNWSMIVSSSMAEANSTLKPRCQTSATPPSVGVVLRTAGKGTMSKALTWSFSIVAWPFSDAAEAATVSRISTPSGMGSTGVMSTARLSRQRKVMGTAAPSSVARLVAASTEAMSIGMLNMIRTEASGAMRADSFSGSTSSTSGRVVVKLHDGAFSITLPVTSVRVGSTLTV